MTEIYADLQAERYVLAACLEDRFTRDNARRVISREDFLESTHAEVWDAFGRLDRHKRAVDPATMLATLQGNAAAVHLLPDLVTLHAIPANVEDYAKIVRAWGIRRRIWNAALWARSVALNPATDAQGLAASVATRFASVRDSGITEDVASITLAELLAGEDDQPDWLIPNLLERRDRLLLTGEEGLGKSYMLRQIAVMAAAGMDPFDPSKRIPPVRATIIDCENAQSQVRRKVRPVVEFAERYGTGNPGIVNLLCSNRIDITRDKDLARLHNELDATQPDMLVIGPLYRLVPRALQTDDEAAPVLAALDTFRERGCALLIEAHAGHAIGKGGHRDLRPRGSSALMGWPEFGYGLRAIAQGYADLVPWRGDRDSRDWPGRVRHSNDGVRWIPVDAEHQVSVGWSA